MPAKKNNQRLKKLVSRNNERRSQGEVFRIEILFSAKNNRHAEMAAYLGDLPRGGAGEFIRQAVWEKIQREEMESVEVQQFEGLIAGLYDRLEAIPNTDYHNVEYGGITRAIQQMENNVIAAASENKSVTIRETVREVEISQGPTPTTIDQSGGIDMSRSRPRQALHRGPVVPDADPESATDADRVAWGKQMAESIRNAQPGRAHD